MVRSRRAPRRRRPGALHRPCQRKLRQGRFEKAEAAALAFTQRQSEAFGRAAEILTEQRILDSETQGKGAIDDALRFADIGLATNLDSVRLHEFRKLARTRAQGLACGEPIETMNWEVTTDVELNRLVMAMHRDGKYVQAEIAARRCVPVPLM